MSVNLAQHRVAIRKFNPHKFNMRPKTFIRSNLIFLDSYNNLCNIVLLFFFLLFRQKVHKTSGNLSSLLFLLTYINLNIHPSFCHSVILLSGHVESNLGPNLSSNNGFPLEPQQPNHS